ncbi:MAG: GNAT family N-acetyltransferase [Saprospiraceae bacterium]|nr:GNAT family N-acetyltransferase [Saprospiraceae bacterium]
MKQEKTAKQNDMIRKRAEKDNDEILNVWYEASSLAHPFLKDDFVEKAKKDLRDIYIPNTETWVYEENNAVIGFISMIGNEIGGLFVMPSNHFKGIGTQLVNFVKELHGELDVEVFEKNAIGRAFYEKYGFVQLKKYYHAESNNNVLKLRYNS